MDLWTAHKKLLKNCVRFSNNFFTCPQAPQLRLKFSVEISTKIRPPKVKPTTKKSIPVDNYHCHWYTLFKAENDEGYSLRFYFFRCVATQKNRSFVRATTKKWRRKDGIRNNQNRKIDDQR